ncbi:signal peptidase I [Agrobacterium rubi]|uniref:Signal peptidase I n=1 Tax=Agrobacterium rubi TR3 = NBRC 13261 TaxID=1368415 RepID=A0A081D1S6_9HYPH|nr:signal peptidase I [Agrobacterium rubi]MBP1881179.1 signal peptidase I [Agrobacterium rubi]MCL6654537.1 hypothetical protein [Agrobacterium rubi]NTF09288.1 signal peptidase I [Agrobacterium rubi]NTF22197.1 signal peptidase I [Agrobacterium rubi]NTF29054.1 signal peptidase I [Agrobacterium rubi]
MVQVRIYAISLAAVVAMSMPATAQVPSELVQEFTAFILPAYPLYLAQGGAWESDPKQLAILAGKAAAGLAAVAPSDCNAERLRRDFCGLHVFVQPSTSMAPTLLEREMVVRKGYAEGETPKRGDIITFETVQNYTDKPTTYVKRLIGLPGETVELRDGVVFINGDALPQARIDGAFKDIFDKDVRVLEETAPGGRRYRIGMSDAPSSVGMDNAGPFEVPEGHYFVLGDNRHNSADSRFPGQMGENGFVSAQSVSGRIVTIMVSKDKARIGLAID